MRKISLDVGALKVESFETANGEGEKQGTVQGFALPTRPPTMCGQDCLSGWRPCQPTDAWTNGQVMCYCAGGSGEFAC